ncbi:MAG: bifunctional methylenetetrahydrofolate dehydrogenase/methenyltetrahydrofolate cyclohydrolase FolD [Candidatus Peregrinibacteria bacterium]|nr:bifunctional methylenetetrahydrofolate dehydrogenase/methenyltetrahydrofolate cyclohydrolase FolD [Candidatus Peregrinibacteria bacterium]
MQLLDGRNIGNKILDEVTRDVQTLKAQGIAPKLAVVLVGKNPASQSYVRQKAKACEQTGIEYEHVDMPDSASTEEIIAKVEELDARDDVHGILVQLPLPKHVDEPLVIRAIKPKKDVDGFHAYNLGKMFLSKDFESLVPCTPKGVIKMLNYHDIKIEGKEVIIVGHSNIVGKPMSIMFLNRNATVTTCHKFTKDLKSHTLRADILVVAVGKAGLITEDMVKTGAVVVDVGINRVDGKLVGDVDFERIKEKASYITPVPGGAGPMTVACLMENVVEASKRLHDLS